MTNKTNKARRPSHVAPGIKVLITTASIAATVGGWAAFSASDNVNLSSSANVTADQVAAVAQSDTVSQPTVTLTDTPTAVATTNIVVSLAQPTVDTPTTAASPAQATDTPQAQATDTPVPPPTATALPKPTATPVTVTANSSTSTKPASVARTRSSR